MSTLLRLLKLARRHRTVQTITKINFETSSGDALLQPRSMLLTNQFKNNVTLTPVQQEKNIEQNNDISNKVTILKKQIDLYGRLSKSNIDEILNDVKSFGNVTSLQGLFLLQCCSNLMAHMSPKLRLELANDIWLTLKTLGVPLDASHYNAFLYVYVDSEHEFSPTKFLREMVDANVKPNRVTFQNLVWQFCNQGKVNEAIQILEYMTEEKIPMNEEVLSSLVYGYAVNNDVVGVHRALKSIEESSIEPTIKTYSFLMYAYAKMGDINNVRKILQDCTNKDIWVSDKVYLKIVYNLALSDFKEYIDEILSLISKGPNYTKDANFIMCKLIEKQQEDVAFKIFQSLPKSRDRALISGDHFIQTLVNFKTPVEKSIEFCRIMEEEGINQQAFPLAIQKFFANDMYESSIPFMKAWKEVGGRIQMSYFYPIFKAYGETGQSDDIAKILREIILNFHIHPTVSLLRTHILPYMKGDMNHMLVSLTSSLVSYPNALNAILLHSLSKSNIQEAVNFMSTNYPSYNLPLIKYNLLHALRHSEDVPSFVWIVYFLYKVELNQFNSSGTIVNIDKKYLSQQFVDSCILEAINILSSDNKYLIIMLFKNLVAKGLNLSPEIMLEIEKKLNSDIQLEIADEIKALKSGELRLCTSSNVYPNLWGKTLLDAEKLESTAKLLSVQNNNMAMDLRKKLLVYYCQARNVNKASKLLKEMENENNNCMETSLYCYKYVIDMYLDLQEIDEAESIIKKCMAKYETFRTNKSMTLKIAKAFVESGQDGKAREFLQMPTTETLPSKTACKSLLLAVAEYKDGALLQQFYDLLKDHEYFIDATGLEKPLMQYHFLRGDKKSALKIAEQVYEKHKTIPMKLQLMKMFLNNEDQESLNKLLTMSIKSYGRTRTYFDLALCYLEKDNLDESREIIKKYCTGIYEDTVLFYANYYYKNGETQYLEKFFNVLDSLNFDVEKLCVVLLKSYSMKNEWEKSYNLWIKMQEKNIEPSKNFLDYLKFILKKNENEDMYDSIEDFKTAIKKSDLIKAKSLLESIPIIFKSDAYAMLCKKYSGERRFSDIVTLWRELQEKYNVSLDIFTAQMTLRRMVKVNDVHDIEMIGKFLSSDSKKQLNYNYYICQVHLRGGSWNLYMKKLESKLNNESSMTKEDLNLHYRTIVDSLRKHPEFLEQFESLAKQFFRVGIDELMKVCWMYYFLQNDKKADEIWRNHFQNLSKFPWSSIFDELYIYFKTDVEFHSKLAELVQKSKSDKKFKLKIYSKLLSSCIKLDDPRKCENTVKCLELALSEFSMQDFNLTLLADVQNELEASGTTWPWLHKKNKPNTGDLIKSLRT